MKRILFLIALFTSFIATAQKPGNYEYRAMRERRMAQMADSGITTVPVVYPRVPVGTSTQAGLMVVDTAGGGKGFHVLWDGTFHHLIDSVALKDTAAAIRASGGSGSGGGTGGSFGKTDILQDSIRLFDQANYKFTFKRPNITIGGADSIPALINYKWNTNPLGSEWSVSGTAPTTGSGHTVINTSTTLTNSIHTGPENWTMRGSFITGTKSSVAQRVSIAIVSDTLSSVTSRKIMFALEDTAGYINLYYNDGGTTPIASNRGVQQFSWAANDTMDYCVIYRKGVLSTTLKSRANGQRSYLNYSDVSIGNVGQVKLFNVGNFTYIDSFVYKIDEKAHPRFIFAGTSTSIGSGASTVYTRYVNKTMEKYNDTYMLESGAAERTSSLVRRINEIVAIAPAYVVLNYWDNDVLTGSLPVMSVNVRRFCDSMRLHSIGLIFVSTIPHAVNVSVCNDTVTSIASDYASPYINITTTLQAGSGGTNRNSKYDADGVHLNDIGQQVEADVVENGIKALLTIRPALIYDAYPIKASPTYLMALDDKSQPIVVPDGFSNKYIKNITPVIANVSQTMQIAGINLEGDYEQNGRMTIWGNGNHASPSFDLRKTDGITRMTAAIAASLTFANGHWFTSSNDLFVDAGRIVSYQYGLKIDRLYPNTGSAWSLHIDNDLTGGAAPSGFRILDLWSDGVYRASISKSGGGYFSDTLGYKSNQSSIYTARTLVDKNYVDSSITSLGSVTVDSLLFSTRAWRQKGIDSVVSLINAGGTSLNAVTAAGGTNDINNTQYRQRWRWTTLAGDTALVINSTSTTAASNAQVALAVMLKGANATTTQTTNAGYFENTHSGTLAVNYGLRALASGGTTNYAIYTGTASGSDGDVFTNGTITTATGKGITIGNSASLTIASGNGQANLSSITNVGLVNGPISIIPLQEVIMKPGNAETWRFGTAALNSSFTNTGGTGTAAIHLKAGTATASTAPMKFNSGVVLTSPEAGAIEYDGTNFYGTNSTATRGTFMRVVTNASNSGTATLAAGVSDYIFSGTTTTWTLPALTGSTNVKFFIKNRGSGNITINSSAGGNDLYTTSAVSTTTVAPGAAIIIVSDGTFWNVE